MSRVHRTITLVSTGTWVVSIGLMFVQLMPLPDPWSDFWRLVSVNVGALAACLTAVCVMPYLLKEFYRGKVSDYVGAYLAGWAKQQEVEPGEPVRLRVVNN